VADLLARLRIYQRHLEGPDGASMYSREARLVCEAADELSRMGKLVGIRAGWPECPACEVPISPMHNYCPHCQYDMSLAGDDLDETFAKAAETK
jgi:hypothetical protein